MSVPVQRNACSVMLLCETLSCFLLFDIGQNHSSLLLKHYLLGLIQQMFNADEENYVYLQKTIA